MPHSLPLIAAGHTLCYLSPHAIPFTICCGMLCSLVFVAKCCTLSYLLLHAIFVATCCAVCYLLPHAMQLAICCCMLYSLSFISTPTAQHNLGEIGHSKTA